MTRQPYDAWDYEIGLPIPQTHGAYQCRAGADLLGTCAAQPAGSPDIWSNVELVARPNKGPLPEGWSLWRAWWRDHHGEWDWDECQAPTYADAEAWFRECNVIGWWARLDISEVRK